MGAWMDLGAVTDYVHGAESDSGFSTDVTCPKCGGIHLVTLSRIGWFMYLCNDSMVLGHVPEWRRSAVVVDKERSKRGDN